jgi:orotidine-5'-phosphate decarboxylase
MAAHNPIILALDLSDADQMKQVAQLTQPHVGMFKLGLELFVRFGPAIVADLRQRNCPIMLDLKLHDIPNTVKKATRNAAVLGVDLLTIHASGGSAMMRAAREGVAEFEKETGAKGPKLLGVTVLTSIDDKVLADELGVTRTAEKQVAALARLAKESGLDGVVASPREITQVRTACGPGFLIVTPGIRPAGAAMGDQKRTLTPREAVSAGADYIVVGRPVLDAADPLAVLAAIHKDLP